MNGLHLYSVYLAFRPLKVLYINIHPFTHTHSHTDDRGCHASCQLAYQDKNRMHIHTHIFTHPWHSQQEQFGVQCLAQGHLDVWTGGAGD